MYGHVRMATLASCMLLWLSVGPFGPTPLSAQDNEAVPVDSTVVEAAPVGLPIFGTLGFAFGQRRDGCALCPSPDDDQSFAAHLSVGKYLVYGIGVGVDASLWRRSRPAGFADPEDPEGGPATLTNTLGNASIVFSWQAWHVFARAGGGLAWGAQDGAGTGDEAETVVSSTGMGVGYTVGGGITLPLHPMISLAFFGNYNVGQYDLTEPSGVVVRDTRHEVLELGIGVTIR